MIERNHIYNCDCMEGMAEMPDNYISLCIVDPPYGITRYQQKSHFGDRVTMTAHDKINDWNVKPSVEYFDELFRISKYQIIWGANNFTLPESEYFIVWDKQQTVKNFASAELAYTNIKQPAQIFRYSIHQEMSDRKAYGGKLHPTQKPILLYKWLLTNYAKEGDLILDTHMGSGSSYIACLDMGFDYIGYEIDADYFKAIEDRVYHFTRQEALFDV